jgi:hypothetical protein
MHQSLEKIMPAEVITALDVHAMTESQQNALAHWAMSLSRSGRSVIGDIDEVKYDGHVVILDDGSRWEVDDIDRTTASMWDYLDKVVIIDGEMWKLDESEKVSVQRA